MTVAATAFEVPNSLLYVRDPTLRVPPEIEELDVVWHTSSCVAISCLPDCDGPTRVAIGPSDEVGRDRSLIFDGELPSPSRILIVETITDDEVLRATTSGETTRVRIWTNGHPGADNVVIGLD